MPKMADSGNEARELFQRAQKILGVDLKGLAERVGRSVSTFYQVQNGHLALATALKRAIEAEIAHQEQINADRLDAFRALRRRTQLSNGQLAKALNIKPSTIEAIEEGSFPINDFLYGKINNLDLDVFASEVEADLWPEESAPPHILANDDSDTEGDRMASLLKEGAGALAHSPHLTKRQILTYVQQFMDTCGTDNAKLGWFLTELQERYPLNKWKKP